MKKKVIASAVLSVLLVLGMSVRATATSSSFVGSKTQQSVAAVEATIITSGGETVETAIGTTEDLTAEVEEAGAAFGETNAEGEVVSIDTVQTPVIKVTWVQETQQANDDHSAKEENQSKSFYEKAADVTSTGLTYSSNEQVNTVYAAAAGASNTTEFAERFPSLLEKLVEAVKTVIAETSEAYNSAEEVADEDADLDSWNPIALCDISANETAKEAAGEDGKVSVTLGVDGVTKESRTVALNFHGELEDQEKAMEDLTNDYANAVLEYDVTVLPCEAGDGQVTVEMDVNKMSPVMILVQETTEEEETVEEAAEEPAEEEPVEEVTEEVTEETTETESSSNFTLWIVVIILVAAVIIYLAAKGKKKDDTSGVDKK